MTCLLNPYRFGSSGDTSLLGALVYAGSDVTFASGTNSPTYDSEAHDTAGYHSTVTNPDRLTIPAGVTRGRFIINALLTNGYLQHSMLKNGAAFFGKANTVSYNATGDDRQNSASAIVAVTPGDYFTSSLTGGVTLRANGTWASFEPIASTIKGALVKRTGDLSMSAGSNVVDFDAEEYDSDGFHNNVTNNSRLTVPSGVSRVRITGTALISTSVTGTDQIITLLQKNGASFVGVAQRDVPGNAATNQALQAVSAVLAVAPGDYFDFIVNSTLAETLQGGDNTWFQIEEIPAARKYAVVYKSATQAMSDGNWVTLAFGAELADTDGFHDNATNNSRLTVPSGCTRARLSFNVQGPNSTATFHARAIKNGSAAALAGMPSFTTDTSGGDNLNGLGAWVDVTPGDYFELQVMATGSSPTLAVADGTWLCIEAE